LWDDPRHEWSLWAARVSGRACGRDKLMEDPRADVVEETPCDWAGVLSALVGLVGRRVEVCVSGAGRATELLSCQGILQPLEVPAELVTIERVTMIVGDDAMLGLIQRHFASGYRSIYRFPEIEPLIESVTVYERSGISVRVGDDWKALWPRVADA
jgi:hypothetical protein